jgi:NAD(P)H-nitrite reductase large subunit
MDEKQIIICRCEEVTIQNIVDTVRTYQCSSRELKLRTRAGMGYCGGRTCRQLINTILENEYGPNYIENTPLKYQPPVRPVSFECMGGIKK